MVLEKNIVTQNVQYNIATVLYFFHGIDTLHFRPPPTSDSIIENNRILVLQ